MKKFLVATVATLLLVGCSTYTQIRSPRYFNQEIEIVDYRANPWYTEWKVRAEEGEEIVLVFNYETIKINFEEVGNGEFEFTVSSSFSEEAEVK